jgi:hypothetical protein
MEKGMVYQSTTTTTIPNHDLCPQQSTVKLRKNVMSDTTASPDTVVSIDDPLNIHTNEQLPPLVNSSLMFFSTRPISTSLNMLANSPHLYPRAMEILLRNWSGVGESLQHANILLQEPACCQGLLGPNWKCWYGDDGTLFDLAYQNVAKSEQSALFKALQISSSDHSYVQIDQHGQIVGGMLLSNVHGQARREL